MDTLTSTMDYVMILHCTCFIATGIMNINFTVAKRNPANIRKRILYVSISLRKDKKISLGGNCPSTGQRANQNLNLKFWFYFFTEGANKHKDEILGNIF